MRFWTLIPTYNERTTIDELFLRLEGVLQNFDAKVLVVDDNSPDGTANFVEELAGDHSFEIEVVRRPTKLGLGTAYLHGISRALSSDPACEAIVQMDADLSHRPEELPKLVEKLEEGWDLAIGSRRIAGGKHEAPWLRKLLSLGANELARLRFGLRVRDATSGFRAYRREVAKTFLDHEFLTKGFTFQVESLVVAARSGFRICEVPISFAHRTKGSKLSSKEILEYSQLILRGISAPRGAVWPLKS